MSDAESTEVSVYDMEDQAENQTYPLSQGTFTLQYVSSEMAYGLWDSISSGYYYSGIHMATGEKKEFFEANGYTDYIQAVLCGAGGTDGLQNDTRIGKCNYNGILTSILAALAKIGKFILSAGQ